jgi:hypothetical protein
MTKNDTDIEGDLEELTRFAKKRMAKIQESINFSDPSKVFAFPYIWKIQVDISGKTKLERKATARSLLSFC